jgi:hypothetical protein
MSELFEPHDILCSLFISVSISTNTMPITNEDSEKSNLFELIFHRDMALFSAGIIKQNLFFNEFIKDQ